MAKMGKLTCLSQGIWARRPWNPLGKQAVWYAHDFERINQRDIFGIQYFDARCKRCGVVEIGWHDALPLPGRKQAPEEPEKKAKSRAR